MQNKTLIAILIVAAMVVAVFLISSGDDDAAIVAELARKESASRPEVSLDATSAEHHPINWDLTSQVKVSKNESRETWLVQLEDVGTMIQLPFPPTPEGGFKRSRAETGPDGLPRGIQDATSVPERASSESGVPESGDRNPGYVGAIACAECHRENHDSFLHTAHFNSSGPIEASNIQGPVTAPSNRLRTADARLWFEVLERETGYEQRVSFADWKLDVPMDVFTGTAKTGRSFLYWHGDSLFQTHVSYMAGLQEWIPSPGFSNKLVDYSRPIRAVCLECHITYIDVKRPPNHYHRDTAIWGVTCERCHGPGQKHVEFHRSNPTTDQPRHIVHPTDLSRQRQLDICGQCHSGLFELRGKPFTYTPGMDLSQHHTNLNPDADEVGGIHTSNQLTRLSKSECFQATQMTCTSCHDPHQNQRADVASFTKSCLMCHEPTHCGKTEELGASITDDCVSCHMPVSDNDDIVLQGSRGNFTMQMTDHYIRVVGQDDDADQDANAVQEENAAKGAGRAATPVD